MQDDSKLRDYRALLEKVSAKFEEIQARHPGRMQCGQGCHQCCAPGLTVFGVERANLKALLVSDPSRVKILLKLAQEDPHGGTRCRFLSAEGSCLVYSARPLVCRSHGAPIFSREGEDVVVDVCRLNFEQGTGIEGLEGADFVNIDLLNQILVLINRRFDEDRSSERFPLTVEDILR